MSIPDRTAYNKSVLQIASSVTDPKLKKGSVRLRKGGKNPLSYNGGFATVFVVDSEGETYALKCWTHDIGDSRTRYAAVTNHLKTLSLPYIVDFVFNESGIKVGSHHYPTLRMRWVNGESLDEFVATNISKAVFRNISAAAETFRLMCADLGSRNMAHGDLQGANIKAEMNAGKVKMTLIDYDTMVVPALSGTPRSTTGSPHFQHPQIDTVTKISSKDDHFPSLCIYLSLLALGDQPSLWQEFHQEEEGTLLFRSDDFKGTSPTPVFLRLYALGGMIRHLAIILWNFKSCANLALLPSLEEAISLASAATGTPPPAATPASATPAKSDFDDFLKISIGTSPLRSRTSGASPTTNSGWLDDSVFRTASSPPTPGFSVSKSPPSYSPSSAPAPAPSYSPPPPQPQSPRQPTATPSAFPTPALRHVFNPPQSASSPAPSPIPASAKHSIPSKSSSDSSVGCIIVLVVLVLCFLALKACSH